MTNRLGARAWRGQGAGGPPIAAVLGSALGAVGFALWAGTLTDLSLGAQWPYILMAGAGVGLLAGPVSTDAVNRAIDASYGEVTGITQTVRNYGSALGVAVLGTVLTTVFADRLTEQRLAHREHRIAIELQGAMLGRIDPVPGLPVGVVYRPSELGLQVGGDWYDLIDLDDDLVGLVVGDVVGHDLHAAAIMGQLRTAVRAMAPTCVDPAELLARADRFAEQIDGAACTTLAYATLDRRTGRLEYACAGHPPPLLLDQDTGDVHVLDGGRGAPLACVNAAMSRRHSTTYLRPGNTLVLYTDGLVERRTEDLDTSMARLLSTARGVSTLHPADFGIALADRTTAGHTREDDLCILTVRFGSDAEPVHLDITIHAESSS